MRMHGGAGKKNMQAERNSSAAVSVFCCCRYGIYLLIVEILGASTVILYGTNLLWNPVIEKFPEDTDSPGKPKVRSQRQQQQGATQPACLTFMW